MKENLVKVKWILKQSKPIIPFLIFTITITSSLSLIGVYNALVSKSLIDSAISGNKSEVIKWLIIMGAIMFGRMLISPLTSLLTTHTSLKFNQKMQKRIYKHITYSKWQEQNKHHSISLLTRITNDVNNISSVLIGTIPSIISLSVTLIASFITLLKLAPKIALIAIFLGPFLLLISKFFGSKLKILYKKSQEADVKFRSFIQETLNNITIVKTFCLEKNNLNTIDSLQSNLYKLNMKNIKVSLLSGLSLGFCSSVAYFSIFCFGALNIANGIGTYGTMTAMLQLYSNVQTPFSSLASIFPSLVGAIAAAERLMEIEDMTLEDEDLNLIFTENINPKITLKNVKFSYKKDNFILNEINLSINPGETIAFIGASGEGKTTLIKLLLSLIDPSKGNIDLYYNNTKFALNRSHRKLISYVPQGNTLFSGTISDNLRFGKLDASSSDIIEATKLACAFDFITKLDDGFDTIISEKGTGISEGQAQRISIARAFLRKKPILILDEATSSLDPDTEFKVIESVKNLSHKPTCIIITHRPQALSICDRVIKLTNGNIVDVTNEYLDKSIIKKEQVI